MLDGGESFETPANAARAAPTENPGVEVIIQVVDVEG